MGATGWKYFVPYDSDLPAALERLRQSVFARGDYLFGWGLPPKKLSAAIKRILPAYEARMKENFERANDPSQSDTVRAAAMHAAEHMKKEIEKYKGGSSKPEEKPKTPDELLERQAETGTHSILDITTISNTPDFSAISPLPRERLAEVFGTESPTRSQIEKAYKAGVLEEFISERWQGIYIIAFRDGTPSEIFFAGCSGD